uniref:Uncharacterized protein n=1 Tax=viral metagenome TaxID=1070528 RepID=A0A6C0E324_9ZZZZ
MTSLRKYKSRPLTRSLGMDPNLNTDNSVIYNYPLGVTLESQLSVILQTRITSWRLKDASQKEMPPQIKNKNMDKILDEYYLSSPQRTMERSYYYAHVDQRLEWLSSSVEEADNEEKNNETFGVI